MPHKIPPVEYQFKKGHPGGGHTQKHPNGYLTSILKKLLKKKITYEDPETKEMVKGLVKDILPLRLIYNASQGELPAIKEIFDRVDGKVVEKTELSGEVKFTQMQQIKIGKKDLELDIG